MKTNNFKKILSLIFVLVATQVYAAPLSTNVLVSELEPKVGQDVNITLRITAERDNPIYTLSSKISYDSDKLTFKNAQILEEGTLPLVEVPYHVTDTAEGIVVRTAGFPRGYAKSGNFIRYTFTAKKNGQAYVYFLGGQALDSENNDLGVATKEIILSIGGDAPVSTSVTEVAQKEPSAFNKKTSLAFNVFGDTAVCREKDYEFNLTFSEKVDKSLQGDYKIIVLNDLQDVVFTKDMSAEVGSGNTITLSIPANSLPKGNLLLRVQNANVKQISDKELGVINCDEKNILQQVDESTYDRGSQMLLGLFMLLLAISLIYIVYDKKNFKHVEKRNKIHY